MEAGSVFFWILILAGSVLVFLAVREIITWYWKIDTIIKNQDTQIQLLKELLKEKQQAKTVPTGSEINLNV